MPELAAAALAVLLLVPATSATDTEAPCDTAGSEALLPGRSATAPPDDPWFGGDKLQHFGMSFAITAFTFAGARVAGMDREPALGVAVPLAAVAGVGKEIRDRRRGGFFSVRDLVADALGITAAYFLLREVR